VKGLSKTSPHREQMLLALDDSALSFQMDAVLSADGSSSSIRHAPRDALHPMNISASIISILFMLYLMTEFVVVSLSAKE